MLLRERMIAKKIDVNTDITYCNERNLAYLADELNIIKDNEGATVRIKTNMEELIETTPPGPNQGRKRPD